MGTYLYIPMAKYPHSKNILEHRPEQDGTRNDGSLQQEVFPPHRLKKSDNHIKVRNKESESFIYVTII